MSTIAENLNALYNIKEGIKAAIEGKGVDVGEAPFAEYPQKINEIEVGGADCEGVYQEGWDDGYTKGFYEGEDTHYNEGWMDCKKNYETKMVDLVVTENGIYNDAQYGYKSVNVKVEGTTIRVADGIKFCYSNWEYVPNAFDFNNITDIENMFQYNRQLKGAPEMDTRMCTSTKSMFAYCSKLLTVPAYDTSSVTLFTSMFASCSKLVNIPAYNVSVATALDSMYDNCTSLEEVGNKGDVWEARLVTKANRMFSGCVKLKWLPKFIVPSVTNMTYYFGTSSTNTLNDLTSVGGWENLKCKWDDNYGLAKCPNLDYDSCITILNGLYDFNDEGGPASTQGVLKVHQNFLDLVGDKIRIGVDKGWTITA